MLLTLEEDDSVFVPNSGGQQEFLDDWENPFVALAGGWYAGKTWAGARKLATLHTYNAFDDNQQPTYVRGLMVAQNYSLARQVNIPELQGAFDEMGLAWKFIADPKRYCFEFPDLGTKLRPSELLVRSADAPETINAFTVGHAWGDETPRWPQSIDDPKRDANLQMKGRVRDPKARFRQCMYTFTHEGDDTQMYRDFEEKPLPGHKMYRAGTFENPFAKAFAETMEGQLTPELRDQYLKGLAANFRGGKVYGSFNAESNVSDQLILDDSLPLCLAIDWNINPGMHGIVGQHVPSADLLTAVHELHAKSMSAVQMFMAFKSLVTSLGGWKWPELHIFGDASGGGRFEATGETCWGVAREWFANHMPGVNIRWRYKSQNPPVADRVNAMNCALRTMDGRVRYKAHPRCERLIQDFKSLKWDGNEIGKQDRKLSHASDADGYRVDVLMPVRKGDRIGSFSVSTAS